MDHVLIEFLKTIHKRVYRTLKENTGETQFGFKNGMETCEAHSIKKNKLIQMLV